MQEDVSFWQFSFDQHASHNHGSDQELARSWQQFDTIDAWRHVRMYECVLPFLKQEPSSSWLTIGDGRYGTDANYLLRNGAKEVLASDISTGLLEQAVKEQFIKNCKAENAEQLSFPDGSFDYVFCKEAYHHFPRPMIAFYEMLRVARKAVVIIEPNDVNVLISRSPKVVKERQSFFRICKDTVKDFLGITRYHYQTFAEPSFETIGNYVYTVSEREFEKAALGLNLPVVAFKGINDYYEEGVEFEKAHLNSERFKRVQQKIKEMDDLCIKEKRPYNILASIIFKKEPAKVLLDNINKDGFRCQRTNLNPYVKANR